MRVKGWVCVEQSSGLPGLELGWQAVDIIIASKILLVATLGYFNSGEAVQFIVNKGQIEFDPPDEANSSAFGSVVVE
ncbi:MAG: hypothetical protein ABII21_01090 [bacterium]